MDETALSAAAERLTSARLSRRRVDGLPASCLPAAEDEAYAIQAAVEARLLDQWGPRVGYKIAATNSASQAMLRRNSTCYAGILSHNLLRSPAAERLDRFVRPGVEVEIAVRLGADALPDGAPWTAAALADRVAACMPALEVVDDRYLDFRATPPLALIADGVFHGAGVIGPERTDWRGLDLAALASQIALDGEVKARGRGADTMGHPLNALAALANALAARGLGLKRDEIVITGSIAPPQWPSGAVRVTAAVEQLGEVSLELIA
jgi:2-oxo-3-hexenedioate decarboxylase/2-keto-4-pentenoate hydratase